MKLEPGDESFGAKRTNVIDARFIPVRYSLPKISYMIGILQQG